MSITEELREYVQDWRDRPSLMDDLDRGDVEGILAAFIRIADRIDAEHEAACAEAYGNGVMHERAMADTKLAAAPTEAQLEEWGYVKLPVDAEGKPIRIGDVMEWCDSGETLTVEGIGRDVLFYIDGENAEWTAARNKRHHHEPTVEDVLQKLLEQAVGYSDAHTTVALNAIAEFAAKLQLREVDE